MKTYITQSGDTFDRIALRELGSEYLFPEIVASNSRHRLTLIFSAGVSLQIPEPPQEMIYTDEPEWLEGDGDSEMTELPLGAGAYG
ncbi:phage tail protein [Exiguobacterium undae]|uniref:phage tail protein n=1 Tax=Exiguobacterium undae TaxID=169177 RepID=UPI003850F198